MAVRNEMFRNIGRETFFTARPAAKRVSIGHKKSGFSAALII